MESARVPGFAAYIDKVVVEKLIRFIYEDRSTDIYEPLMELFSCHPMDLQKIEKAREKLLKAATKQMPSHHPWEKE